MKMCNPKNKVEPNYTMIENNPEYYVIAKLETPELSIDCEQFSEGEEE